MTNGIKIPIEGDLSGLTKAVKDFGQQAQQALGNLTGKAQIDTVTAKKDLAELQKSVQGIHDALSSTAASDVTGKAVDGLSKQFDHAVNSAKKLEAAISKAAGPGAAAGFAKTVGETRKLIAEMEKAKRLQAALAKEGHQFSLGQAAEIEKDFQHFVKNGGRQGKRFEKFGDLATYMNNWRDTGTNEMASRRQYRAMLQQLGVNAPGAPNPGQQPRSFGQFMRDSISHAGRGFASAASPVSGVGATIMGNAAEEAAASPGGLFSGAGMGRLAAGGAIGLAAYGGIRAIGAIHGQMQGAEQEGTGYADLSRQLGDTSIAFEELRTAIRSASTGLDVSFGEGGKLASMYVHNAGVDGMQPRDIHGEMLGAGGFARSMGMDPQAGVGFFSNMRHNQVSGGESDNKRIGMMIGEGIARAGVFTKADEVLSAVAGYTQNTARSSFAAPNVEGYMGGMSNLMSLKLAGLDPSASASMLGKADSGIRNPNSEAARTFFLGMMQRQLPGMNALDVGALQDTGAFGTAEMAFGANSPAARAATANGDTALANKYSGFAKNGGKTTNLDRVIGGMAGMGTDSMRENLKGFFGYNSSEANAMIEAYRTNGGMSDAVNNLGKYGVDTSKMGPTSIKHMLDIEYGDEKNLPSKANYLRSQNLSPSERKMLDEAQAKPGEGNTDLKSALIKISSTRNMEMTEGDVSRKNMAALDNMASDIATKLIPMTNSIREGIVAMANVITLGRFKDTFAKEEDVQSIADKNKALMGGTAEEPGRGGSQHYSPMSVGNKDAVSMFKNDTTYDGMFKKAGEANGVDWRILKQIAIQESAMRSDIQHKNKNGTTDVGLMQLNDRYNGERGVTDASNPEQNIMAGAGVFARALRDSKGDLRGAFRRYNGSGPDAEAYADKSMRLNSQLMGADSTAIGGMPLPAGTAPTQSQNQVHVKVDVGGKITQEDKNGRQVGAPIAISGIGAPAAAGQRR